MSAGKGLLKPTIQITLLSLTNILLTFIIQVTVAYYFGARPERDAYFAAMVIPTYIASVFIGSIGVIFLPIFVGIETKGNEKDVQNFLGNAITFSTLLSIIIVALIIVFSKEIIVHTAPGFEGKQLALTSKILTILIPTIGFQIITHLIGSVLQVRKRFILPGLAPIFSAMVTLIVVLIFSNSFGVTSLAYGTLIGSIISCVLLLLALHNSITVRLTLNIRNQGLTKLIYRSAPLLLAGIIYKLTGVFERGIASSLPGGSISYLGYANQIMTILATVTSSGIAVSIYPIFSEAWIQRDMNRLFYYFRKGIRVILLISLPISAVFILWGEIIISIMFERGAFNHVTTIAVYKAFSFMVFAFISNCLGSVVVKILYLSNKTIVASFSELAGLIFYLIPAFLLSKEYGYIGMAIASSIGATLSILLSFILSLKVLGSFRTSELSKDFYKITISLIFTSLASYFCYYCMQLLIVSNFASFFFAMIIFLGIYIYLLKYFKIEEMNELKMLYKSNYAKIIS